MLEATLFILYSVGHIIMTNVHYLKAHILTWDISINELILFKLLYTHTILHIK